MLHAKRACCEGKEKDARQVDLAVRELSGTELDEQTNYLQLPMLQTDRPYLIRPTPISVPIERQPEKTRWINVRGVVALRRKDPIPINNERQQPDQYPPA